MSQVDFSGGRPPPPPAADGGEPPAPPTAVLPYATPFGAAAPVGGAWRDGARLVTVTRTSLPQACLKCGAPADGFYGPRTFHWHHPALVLLVLLGGLGIIALVVVALVTRKSATLDVGLCAAHRARRRTAIAVAWALTLAGLASMVYGFYELAESDSGTAAIAGSLTGVALWITAAVVYTKLGTYLTPTKIDAYYGTFKGAGTEFLNLFPPVR